MTWMPRVLFQPIRGTLPRFATAIGLAAAGAGLRLAVDHMLPPGFPFLTFFPAVILSAFLAGRLPGIVCAVLSGLAAWYWFMPPFNSFHANGPVVAALLFYAVVVTVDIALIDGLLHRQARLVENQRQLADMADYQALLFKELQHRVANNLASVASMLHIQRRQIARDPSVALDVIDSATARIELMGRVHRQLYDPAARETPLPQQITRVVQQAQDVTASGHVQVVVNAVDARIDVDRMMTLMLLVTEVLTNSIKHAFDAGRTLSGTPGEVRITLDRCAEHRLRLTMSDNGRGMAMPEPSAQSPNRGLGSAIMRGFVSQLGGTLAVESNAAGVTTVVEFPEAADD